MSDADAVADAIRALTRCAAIGIAAAYALVLTARVIAGRSGTRAQGRVCSRRCSLSAPRGLHVESDAGHTDRMLERCGANPIRLGCWPEAEAIDAEDLAANYPHGHDRRWVHCTGAAC